MPFAPEDLTQDHFLDGRLRLWQPRRGYRAATDPVLLAAAVPARGGESVLDLGAGAGAAVLCLGARVAGLGLHAVERQADYAELARRNAAANGQALEVAVADLRDLPPGLRASAFDHVITNPPYYPASGPAAADPGRDTALREDMALSDWVDAALRRLRPGGWLTLIHLAERLPDLLSCLSGRASVAVLPLCPRAGRPAGRVILCARKGGRAPFRLLAPLVLHAGPSHARDADDFTPEAAAVLRGGDALDLGLRRG